MKLEGKRRSRCLRHCDMVYRARIRIEKARKRLTSAARRILNHCPRTYILTTYTMRFHEILAIFASIRLTYESYVHNYQFRYLAPGSMVKTSPCADWTAKRVNTELHTSLRYSSDQSIRLRIRRPVLPLHTIYNHSRQHRPMRPAQLDMYQ